MFSVAAIRPCTSTGDRSCGSAPMIPSTAAAPAMSYFIRSIPSEVLRSSPPESKVMPLPMSARSEEHTSELQSQSNLVCRLLLEKKKNKQHDYCKSNLH